jgi:excisionase family DNA binding protein
MASATKFVKTKPQLPGVLPRLLTAEEVAEITGLSTETLAQWRSQRKGINFVKISRNAVRYRQSDLEAWLTERIVRVEQDPSNATRRI